MSYDVEQLRATEFPVTQEYVYFVNCGIAPTPVRAARAAQQFVEDTMRCGVLGEEHWYPTIEQTRTKLARLVGSAPEQIALVKNTSEGFNIIAGAIPWQTGDKILIAEGEFPAAIYPWQALEAAGVEVCMVPTPHEQLHPELFVPFLEQGNVRLVVASWVQFHTGWRTDLAALGAVCRAAGAWVCVDVIQGLGALPLDLGQLPVDFCVWGGNKWLMSVQGAGGMYVNPALEDQLLPANVGWLGADWQSFESLDPATPLKTTVARYEEGTRSMICLAALEQSLDLILELGPAAIAAHIHELTDQLVQGLEQTGSLVRSVRTDDHWSGIVSWYAPHADQTRIAEYLRSQGVLVTLREGSLRAAPHCYNNEQDVQRLLQAYQEALREVR